MPERRLFISLIFIVHFVCALWMPETASAQSYDQTGKISYYADWVHGHLTANGERYNKDHYTAAHRTLPFNSLVRVTNPRNGKSVIVRVNDRGPHTGGRILDISMAAARALDMVASGIITARTEYIGLASHDPEVNRLLTGPNRVDYRKAIRAPYAPADLMHPHLKPVPLVQLSQLSPGSFHDEHLHRAQPGGYGVHIATYDNSTRCFYDMKRLSNKYASRAYLYTRRVKGHILYHLVLGCFTSPAEAAALQQQLATECPSGYVMAFQSLRSSLP